MTFNSNTLAVGGERTWASIPLEVHMVPLPVIDFAVDGLGLGGSRAHVQQQVKVAVQHFNGKEIHLRATKTRRDSVPVAAASL